MGCGKPTNPIGPIHSAGCVCDVVRAILDIQNQAVREECQPCTANCFLEPLGGIVSPSRSHADTRVFMLITKDGTPFKAFFSSPTADPCICTSVFFRVEDMFDECCATLRVLEPLCSFDSSESTVDLLSRDGCCVNMKKICKVDDWNSTESCITVDLSCFCAVQCIADVDLGICD